MRIISGSHKGRKLTAPKNLPVRPTTDFAKEGLFNILRNRIYFDEISVLDLFAGTGNISFEFASRGVPAIVAVDSHLGCTNYIEKVATEFEFPIIVHKAEAEKYLDRETRQYDVVFADPPYDFDRDSLAVLVSKVFKNNLLAPEGVMIVEHAKQLDLSQLDHFSELRKYGGSIFSFFQ